jgi:hypothetical protein
MLNHFLTMVLDQDSFFHTNKNKHKIRTGHRKNIMKIEAAGVWSLTLFLVGVSSLIVSVLPHAAPGIRLLPPQNLQILLLPSLLLQEL